MDRYISDQSWDTLRVQFDRAAPFRHVVVDNFFKPEIADFLYKEFPAYNSDVWNAHYNNPLENKKACDHWTKFPPTTYKVFNYLCSNKFKHVVEYLTGHPEVQPDIGLHGGGLHAHARSGKLNIHLDYSIHPKLDLERHYNLIVYLTPNWDTAWGGGLELWSHDAETNSPKECITTVENKFNRAVLFDTTQNSWHGLPAELNCPDNEIRRSLAMYYVTEPTKDAPLRPRAKYAPYGEQSQDQQVLDFIEKRQQL